MRKRKPVVVLSSSEDEVETRSARRTRDPCKSTPEPLSVSRKRTRGRPLKEGDSGGSDFRHSRKAEANKFATLSEDFCDCLQDFHLSSGNQCTNCNELWVDKYKPGSIAQLAVHKKKVDKIKNWLEERLITSKVDEIKNWLEERLRTSKGNFENILLLTGPAGVGKSATVHVIASQLGAQLCEWTTPTPTLWQEHVHNVNSGLRYMSKLDEFEAFAERIGKYSMLYPSAEASSKPNIILIDDLPVTNGRVAFERLKRCLTTLTSSAQLPTIILMTEFHKIELGDNSTNHWEELVSLLEGSGAHKVAFNPLTVNSIKKVLSMLCQEEKCDVTPEQIEQIAKASGGDIRSAITSLQYSGLVWQGKFRSTFFPCGRDETLSLFHALGKFLHNKREVMDELNLGSETILKNKFVRKPLKLDSPEKVFCQAYGQARPVTDFLHENVLDFMCDGAIDDAWLVTSYLSDADCFLGSVHHVSHSQIFDEMYESQNLSQSVASSVAIRGTLFGNSLPVSSRWHTIRSPRLWQIEHSAKQNMIQMLKEKFITFSGLSSSMSEMITEYRPSIRWLSSQATDGSINADHFSDKRCSDDLEENGPVQESGDEIEDW